jgi:hypothetical protein
MKKYKITSIHDVYEDSYNEGELNFVNGYNLENEIKANNWKDAIKEYFEDFLYYSFDINHADIYENRLNYSVLVDESNNQIGENDIDYKQWKEDKVKLYSNKISIEIQELKTVNLD